MITSYGAIDHCAIARRMAEAILDGRFKQTTAWEACTNKVGCGGLNSAARAIIQQALKKAGYVFYIAIFCHEEQLIGDSVYGPEWWSEWGIISLDALTKLKNNPDSGLQYIANGRSLGHAAHKLGKGDARKGLALFHSNPSYESSGNN